MRDRELFWGRYELLEVGLHPCVEPTGDSLHVGLLNHAKAIEFRDRPISARLRALGGTHFNGFRLRFWLPSR